MCVRNECTIIKGDGSEVVEETIRYCDKADRRNHRMCKRVSRTQTVYNSHAPSIVSDTSSPSSNGPFTPPAASSSGYRTETRRPSGTGRRPSIHDTRAIRPEIVISIGNKKYPRLSLPTAKSPKRNSYGSINSNEAALESPTSDTIRTGFPESPIPPPSATVGQHHGYTTRDASPQNRRHNQASSYTTASQVPSLVSEPESPRRRNSRHHHPTLVHQPAAPPSPTTSRVQALSTSRTTSSARSNYRTTTVTPQRLPQSSLGVDGVTPTNYDDFIKPPSSTASSAGSGRAAAPEITDRAEARDRQRKEHRRQDEAHRKKEDREAEEKKQVRFELDRAKSRDEQRAELKFAQSQNDRAKARDELREQKRQQDRREPEPEKRATRKPEREKTKPPTKDFNLPKTANTSRSRRGSISMTQNDIETRDRLLREEQAQMSRERVNVDRLEREEQLAQSQRPSDYYNPRVVPGDLASTASTVGAPTRRPSVTGRRPSLSGRRPSSIAISQPAPPQNPYSTRPTSQHGPPVSYPSAYSSNTSTRPTSSHRSSTFDNPFAQPSTRPVHPSYPVAAHPDPNYQYNPPSTIMSPHHPQQQHDPWDARQMHANLPTVQPSGFPSHPRNALHAQGEQVINRSGDRSHAVNLARQATGRMEQAIYTSTSEGESSGSSSGLYDQDVGLPRRHHKGLGEGKGKRRL